MKIQRHYTEAKFLELMEAGSLKPFDYLQPCNGTTSPAPILKVYIGTTASHWVCHEPMDRDAVELMAEAYLTLACKKSKMPCKFSEFSHSQFVFKNTMLTLQGKIAADEKVKAAEAEAIAGAKKEIDEALDDLVDATETAYEVRAQHQVIHEDADLDQHEVRLAALKEVKRVLDNLTKVTDKGGRPAITDRISYRQLVDESFNSGGIVKQEITSRATYYDFG
jgi:hypothetical protein